MEKTKTYSECEEIREPLSDVQFLYGKIEQLIREKEELKDRIREQDKEIENAEKQCNYAYAFCYELQRELSDVKAVAKRPKKEIQEVIEKRQDDWEYLIREYMDEFTKPYNLRKKEIAL